MAMTIEGLKPTIVYDVYWNFAFERQEIFFRRLQKQDKPWTRDKILQEYKFTNAYRASDRVSQYLIKNVIYCSGQFTEEDMLLRILLFKLFNKIETWEYLKEHLGEITYGEFDYEEYDRLLTRRMMEGQRLYSAAYIMPSGKGAFGFDRKHRNHLKLLEHMMKTGLPGRIARARSLGELYEALLSYPYLGTFLSYQLAIDINYSELCDFSEMSYVAAGPGARNGIRKCFADLGGYGYEDVIKIVAENQEKEFEKRGLQFQTLSGRRLQLIDCQNLFCETDKYARISHPQIRGTDGRNRIKQKYKDRGLDYIDYMYPPKWGIAIGKKN